MDYKEFCKYVENHFNEFIPAAYSDYSMKLHAVSKPNIGEKIGLTLVPPIKGQPAPVIYLDPFYEAYLKKDMDIGRIMVQIGATAADGIEKAREQFMQMKETVGDLSDWNKVKSQVTVRTICVSRNMEMLKDMPCRLHGDIALIYQVSVTVKDNTQMTVRITNDMMKHYGITEPQLYETALENTQRMQKVTCRPMGEVLGDIFGMDPDEPLVGETPEKMYVLSTQNLNFGAAALFYPGVIEKIGKSIPEGFYVLPSSIHEVLILPKNQGEKAMLENMVQQINATQVAPDDVLSDFVSEYDAQTRTMIWGENPTLAIAEQLKEKTPERAKDVIL